MPTRRTQRCEHDRQPTNPSVHLAESARTTRGRGDEGTSRLVGVVAAVVTGPDLTGELSDRSVEDRHMVRHRVRSGVAWAEQCGEGNHPGASGFHRDTTSAGSAHLGNALLLGIAAASTTTGFPIGRAFPHVSAGQFRWRREEVGRVRQLPVKRGGRFSTNACAASRWSLVRPVWMWWVTSTSMNSSSVPFTARLRFSFM